MDLIEVRDIHKIYRLGEVDLPVLKGISLRVARGTGGVDGRQRLRQEHADACTGLPGSSERGRVLAGGAGNLRPAAKERARVRKQTIGFVFQCFNLLARTARWRT